MDTTLTDPLVGRVLDGRYSVQSRLARGGMATVYRALDSRLDRVVALKVMHPGLAHDEQFVFRFIREARSAARLNHPNVVAVFDQGADGGHVFLSMEYVAGRTLRDLLRERGQLRPREALEILESVLAALGAAHHAGIVHRDVKPENVLLADDGRVKVADFGLARAVSGASNHTSSTGVVMGTVAYLAPEQVVRGVADARSDVYAAGIVLFELLTGHKPYEGESAIQIAYRHVHDDVPPPSSRRPGLASELDALVVRATSRDPDGRPEDARRFLAEVTAARRALSEDELDLDDTNLDDTNLDDTDAASADAAATADRGSNRTLVVPIPVTEPRRRLRDGHDGTDGTDRTDRTDRTGPTGALPSTPPRKRPRRRGLWALLVVLLLAAALSAAAWYYGTGPGSLASPPRLIKLSQQAAESKAQAEGFDVRVSRRVFDEQIPAGSVVTTVPGPTGRIHPGGTVGLVLSKGQERYAVPEVTGQSRAEASRRLTATHLTPGVATFAFSDDVNDGAVVSTQPAIGVRIKRNQAVTLVISKGVEPVPVPDAVGKTLAEAKTLLDAAPLRNAVKQVYDKAPDGQVIKQAPSSGTAPKNSEVRLVVSKGPPPAPVPSVVDLKVDEALRRLHAAGFTVRRQGTGFLNRVFDQSPNGGTTAPRGSTITIRTI